jgi:3-oxoacyl-[acyl-carrier-protein] synthase-3
MAYFNFKNVHIAGVSAAVPKNLVSNLNSQAGLVSAAYSSEDFVAMTGVKERRFSEVLCASDLCFAAAEKLISDLGWAKSEIDAILFVSQYPDYKLPCTACILQDRLGLSKECWAQDSSLGCTGWVYGLSTLAGLLQGGSVKKALLLVGDGKRWVPFNDPLFGHAGTATALEYSESPATLCCHYGTDGSGYDAIIIPDGGARNGIKPDSFVATDNEGRMLNSLQPHMKGMDVFSFGITAAPRSVKKLSERFGINYLEYDYYLFHQANLKMNNMIVKKLKIDPEKAPNGMLNFGNTSSASIPLLMVSQIRDQIDGQKKKFMCCGFGVGLSWGTVAFEQAIRVSPLVEVADSEANFGYRIQKV